MCHATPVVGLLIVTGEVLAALVQVAPRLHAKFKQRFFAEVRDASFLRLATLDDAMLQEVNMEDVHDVLAGIKDLGKSITGCVAVGVVRVPVSVSGVCVCACVCVLCLCVCTWKSGCGASPEHACSYSL